MEQQYQDGELEINLVEVFYALLDRIWVIVIAVVAGALISAIATVTAMTPLYSSTSMIYVKNQGADLSSLSVADLQVSSELTSDYIVLATSRPVVNKVIKDLELDTTYEKLSATMSVTNETDTRVLKLTIENVDPYMAKTIVDDWTKVMIKRTAEIMDTNEPKIVEEGTVNETPISPSLKKNVALGGILGFLIAAIAIVVLYLMDDTIHTPEDIERYLGLNTLGTIPMEEGKSRKEERKRDKKRQKMLRKQKKKKGSAA